LRRSEEFGITKDNWKIDMPAVRERKRKMVTGWLKCISIYNKKSGAELVIGSGHLLVIKPSRLPLPMASYAFFTASGSSSTRAPVRPSVQFRLAEANP